MISNFTPVFQSGIQLQPSDSRESKFLFAILGAIKNMTGALYPGNTITSSQVLAGASQTIAANTVKSVQFLVVQGTLGLVIDGGTSIPYPVGNYEFNTAGIKNSLVFTQSAGVGDNSFIQTLS